MEFHQEYQDIIGCAINDPLAAAILIQPDLVEYVDYFMTVELHGEHTTAKTSVDHFKTFNREPNARVAMKVDVERFMTFFIERMARL
jgi:purine nucleosidase